MSRRSLRNAQRAEHRYSSNCKRKQKEDGQILRWRANKSFTHLCPQEIVAPSERHIGWPRRVVRVPRLVNRLDNLVHPLRGRNQSISTVSSYLARRDGAPCGPLASGRRCAQAWDP